MLTKRIIPCLDVKNGRVVKGKNFTNLSDVDDPVALAARYSEGGADELVFYDITASSEGRALFCDVLKKVAANIFIPLTVGGGINSLDDFDRVLKCGADKVSVNSGAISDPTLIEKAAKRYGNQCVVLSMDVKLTDCGYKVFSKGGRIKTEIDAVEWARFAENNGAGEIVVNSIDTDGVKKGFDLPMLNAVCGAVSIPVVASGGAGSIDDFINLFKNTRVDAGLGASVFHFNQFSIKNLKNSLKNNSIEVRL
ncbi:MAG: imidazole glycerol phosphate synthase subunit HisF [Clostridia bacterium]|nr:imidazole glycerol phosphate synthase subunit HisF [Clostridia bacterium]